MDNTVVGSTTYYVEFTACDVNGVTHKLKTEKIVWHVVCPANPPSATLAIGITYPITIGTTVHMETQYTDKGAHAKFIYPTISATGTAATACPIVNIDVIPAIVTNPAEHAVMSEFVHDDSTFTETYGTGVNTVCGGSWQGTERLYGTMSLASC